MGARASLAEDQGGICQGLPNRIVDGCLDSVLGCLAGSTCPTADALRRPLLRVPKPCLNLASKAPIPCQRRHVWFTERAVCMLGRLHWTRLLGTLGTAPLSHPLVTDCQQGGRWIRVVPAYCRVCPKDKELYVVLYTHRPPMPRCRYVCPVGPTGAGAFQRDCPTAEGSLWGASERFAAGSIVIHSPSAPQSASHKHHHEACFR